MMNEFCIQESVINRSRVVPVIVEFAMPGCGPCKWMQDTLVSITREMKGQLEFVSLDTTRNMDWVRLYNLTSNPTTIIFVDGREEARITGALPKMAIEQWIGDHLPDKGLLINDF